jgi:hypothetical protein
MELTRVGGRRSYVAVLVVGRHRKRQALCCCGQFCFPLALDCNTGATLRTIETACRAQDRLDDAHDALEALPDVGILGLDRLLLAEHNLQVMVRLLALELSNALVQAVDLRLGALSYGALGLAVVCALPSELLRGEVCNATRGGGRAAFLRGRLTRIGLAVVLSRNR